MVVVVVTAAIVVFVFMVVVVTVAIVIVYHCHYRCLSLWLVVWKVSTCVKLEIKMLGLTCVIWTTHISCRASLRNFAVLSSM